MPETGIEPVRVLPRRILSPVRLPVPPLGQNGAKNQHIRKTFFLVSQDYLILMVMCVAGIILLQTKVFVNP